MTSIAPALADRAARLIDAADGLLITAGAGMGLDSGLPDFLGAVGQRIAGNERLYAIIRDCLESHMKDWDVRLANTLAGCRDQ